MVQRKNGDVEQQYGGKERGDVYKRQNEYTILDEGKEVLDQVARSIAEVGPSINEIRVLGHTAQATANEENDYTVDRFLASNRATVVTVYLQEKEIIDPARLVSVGYGQWRPISSNAIPEERAKNRRVELIVTGLDLDALAGDDSKQYYSMREMCIRDRRTPKAKEI